MSVGLLAASLVGVWGPWIAHPTSSLAQNAFYLAEWASFLPDVRFGEITQLPEWLRLSISLASVALAVAAGEIERRWVRWLIRLAVLLPCLTMLPPYPDIFRLWWSDSYGLRFLVSSIGIVGVAASLFTDRLPEQARRGLVVILGLVALPLGFWVYMTFKQLFTALYADQIAFGWGVILFEGGLLSAVLMQISVMLSQALGKKPLAAT